MKSEPKSTINVQAKTIDQAVKKAAESLGVDRNEIEYELISRTDAGILSFLGSRKVEIKAWATPIASASRQQDTRTSQPAIKEALSKKELDDLIEDLRNFCEGVCDRIADEKTHVSAKLIEDRLILNIDSEYLAAQIGKNSRLAESMEHILRKKPRYLKRELPFRIFVDARKLRASREQELVEMARDLSFKVAENQRPIVLNYKSSYDRKIIHMALDKDDRVYTKSIGSGANRKLMILPVKDSEPQELHS